MLVLMLTKADADADDADVQKSGNVPEGETGEVRASSLRDGKKGVVEEGLQERT